MSFETVSYVCRCGFNQFLKCEVAKLVLTQLKNVGLEHVFKKVWFELSALLDHLDAGLVTRDIQKSGSKFRYHLGQI